MQAQTIKLEPQPKLPWTNLKEWVEPTLPAVPLSPERLEKIGILSQLPAVGGMTTRAAIQGDTGKSLTIDISEVYGVNGSNASKPIRDTYSLAAAQAQFPFLWSSRKREGWTDDKIMAQSQGWAAYHDALWWNADFIPLSDARGLCLSRNTILLQNGPMAIFEQMDMANAARVFGTGTAGSDAPSQKGQTHIIMDGALWTGSRSAAFGLRHFSAGTASNYGYSEGFQFGNVRISGFASKYKTAGVMVTGVEFWDTGEGCEIKPMFIDKCDIGADFVRGTPTVATGVISVFENTMAGIAFTGCSGATVALNVSGDDNSDLILVREGYGRPAGIGGAIYLVKSEWAITSGRTARPQRLLRGEGWIRLHFGFVSHATGNVFQNDLISINPNVNTSHIVIEDLRGFCGDNLGAILHDRLNNKLWKYDNGWNSRRIRIEYFSDNAGMLFAYPESFSLQADGSYAIRPLPFVSAPYDNVTGFLQGDPQTGRPVGSFDLNAGTPAWTYEAGNGTTGGGGTVITPVINSFTATPATVAAGGTVTLTWSTTNATGVTINGVGSFGPSGSTTVKPSITTVYSLTATSSAGQSVAATATATVAANPPSSTVLYSRDNYTNTDRNASVALTLSARVGRIVLDGFRITAGEDGGYYRLMLEKNGSHGLVAVPGGGWIAPSGTVTVNGGDAGKTTRGKTYTRVEIVLSSPMDIQCLLGKLNTGSSLPFTCTRLQMFAS